MITQVGHVEYQSLRPSQNKHSEDKPMSVALFDRELLAKPVGDLG